MTNQIRMWWEEVIRNEPCVDNRSRERTTANTRSSSTQKVYPMFNFLAGINFGFTHFLGSYVRVQLDTLYRYPRNRKLLENRKKQKFQLARQGIQRTTKSNSQLAKNSWKINLTDVTTLEPSDHFENGAISLSEKIL